ncbi:four helix bundle protein [Roseiarcus fermentans]|uniref:Four helix bundle protein n=2 Tax=Roseiarcus fermentans TaxID=1473586 RepID=A0A366F551_9HYPH|nr:four helix bundle protein [Roseiarcus fermentans]
MILAEDSYRFSATLPREELFGLMSQIRRAAVSVPANIAEGYGRDSKGSYVSFLKTAQGSLKELETHLILAQRLKLGSFAAAEGLLARCESIGRMMRGLIRSLQGAPEA